MSVSPINSGRVTTNMRVGLLTSSLRANQSALINLQEQATTGQAFFKASDNPTAAARSIYLQRQIEQNTQLITNSQTDTNLLAASDNSLSSVADSLTQAKALLLAGTGSTATSAEKANLAVQVRALGQQVLREANASYLGRNLFGGGSTTGTVFGQSASGKVVYRGDGSAITSQIETAYTLANNVDGVTAFAPLTTVASADLTPALSLQTPLATLDGGLGIAGGKIALRYDDGAGTVQTATVDLTTAETLGDVKTRIEAALGGAVSVGFDSTGQRLQLATASGTVTASDLNGGTTAGRLGIAGGPAATLTGGTLRPAVTNATKLSDLRGGAGIDTAGGLRITVGTRTVAIDLSNAVTVQDATNAIRTQAKNAGIELAVGLTDDGTGFSIANRTSGEDFSIGENGGTTATDLGLRTFAASTPLADLNGGVGLAGDASPQLQITRRDGSTVTVDLTGAATVGDVLTKLNAVEPGVLVASLNGTGNGISLSDAGTGTGTLAVAQTQAADVLGLTGTASSASPDTLNGRDTNPRSSGGVFDLLDRLASALESGNDAELARLSPLVDAEVGRFSQVRGEVGTRLKTLDNVTNRLQDRDIALRDSLDQVFGADLASVLTEIAGRQTTMQAALQITAQTLSTTLLNYL